MANNSPRDIEHRKGRHETDSSESIERHSILVLRANSSLKEQESDISNYLARCLCFSIQASTRIFSQSKILTGPPSLNSSPSYWSYSVSY
jgi:hypothetical protein